jgi:hypothetical protein
MTDNERKQFIEFLRYYRESSEYGKTWADKAADEIERLAAALAQSDAEPTRDVFMEVLASLVAAVSLLKAGGKKAAPSDKMFDQMILDYERAIERGRSAIAQSDAELDMALITKIRDYEAPPRPDDEDRPLGFRTNDVPNPYAEGSVPSWYETHDDKDVMPDKWSMPDAEPVAWQYRIKQGGWGGWHEAAPTRTEALSCIEAQRRLDLVDEYELRPLYTAPPRPDASAGLIADLERELRLAIGARDYANDMLKRERNPDASAGLIEAAEMAEQKARAWGGTAPVALRVLAEQLRARAADRSGK